uniref:Uncharacterized protein n=1 Tax=Rhizophora mucronata TaxID=61149 RepID=A0A2P2JK08_RHIMU
MLAWLGRNPEICIELKSSRASLNRPTCT